MSPHLHHRRPSAWNSGSTLTLASGLKGILHWIICLNVFLGKTQRTQPRLGSETVVCNQLNGQTDPRFMFQERSVVWNHFRAKKTHTSIKRQTKIHQKVCTGLIVKGTACFQKLHFHNIENRFSEPRGTNERQEMFGCVNQTRRWRHQSDLQKQLLNMIWCLQPTRLH